MALTATCAIVGGGVVGASVAYHLAARGMRHVLVLDRAASPGMGSTGRATGGFRVQFPSAPEVRLSLLAREKLLRFGEETGGDCGFVAAGYLWIAEDEEQMTALRSALGVQRENGVHDAVELDADAVAEANPHVVRAGVFGGTFCASDGFIRPLQILDGYRRAAERLGARFVWDADVTGFAHDAGGRIVTVRTQREDVAAACVVNAAGAWAAHVGALAGADVPVAPLRRQVACTVATGVLPATMPMTIYAGDGFHFRVRDGRVLLLLPSEGADDPFDDAVDRSWVERVARVAHERVPALRAVEIDAASCCAGLYEMSPDGRAILGAAPGVPNFYLANGSSGHGVMHAPALGMLLAEIIVDGRASSLDVAPFRPDRFDGAHAPQARPLL